MSNHYRLQVVCRQAQHLAVDHVVNTFYLADDDPFDFDGVLGLGNDCRTVFNQRPAIPAGYGHEVTIYDMADAEPRPVKAHSPWVLSQAAQGDVCAREVACCLSYYADRNLPRRRGRMYIGPFRQSQVNERPDTAMQQGILVLALGIANLGGADVDWVQHSVTDGTYNDVRHAWCDNEWDTVRSRGLKGTARETLALNE